MEKSPTIHTLTAARLVFIAFAIGALGCNEGGGGGGEDLLETGFEVGRIDSYDIVDSHEPDLSDTDESDLETTSDTSYELPELPACTNISAQSEQTTTFDLVYPGRFVREVTIRKSGADMFVEFGEGQTSWHMGFNRGSSCVEMLFGGPNLATTCFHNSDGGNGATETLLSNWGGPTFGAVAGLQRDVDRECSYGGYYALVAQVTQTEPPDADAELVAELTELFADYVMLLDRQEGGLMAYFGPKGTLIYSVPYRDGSTFDISGSAEHDAGGGVTYNGTLAIMGAAVDPAAGTLSGDLNLSVQISGTSPSVITIEGSVSATRN